jgi:hypothetical protein
MASGGLQAAYDEVWAGFAKAELDKP